MNSTIAGCLDALLEGLNVRLFTAALNFNHQNHGFLSSSVYFSGLKVAPLFALSGVVLFIFRMGGVEVDSGVVDPIFEWGIYAINDI